MIGSCQKQFYALRITKQENMFSNHKTENRFMFLEKQNMVVFENIFYLFFKNVEKITIQI